MHDLKERTAYLRGLVEGAAFPKDEKEKLIWDGLLDFCDDAADELNELTASQNETEDYIEAIDEDLSSLEKYFYNNEESDENLDVVFSNEKDEQGVMELTCPHCSEEIYFEDQHGDYEVICPECGKVVWNSSQLSNTPAANVDVI
jgi:DNA-directed RNA polymerase subunit delta